MRKQYIILNIEDLLKLYSAHPQRKALSAALKDPSARNIFLEGLKGSSAAMLAASLFFKDKGQYLCILNDLEEAAYFYHDLAQLTGGDGIYFFPSAYWRAVKYGHTDPANEILRAGTLSMLQDEGAPFVVVSYPDALAEKVIPNQTLKENTLRIHVKEKLDNMFVSDVLDEYGFAHVDYVYEPGQYATRGSILDVFSFSYEYPYRIDFFGDEVESIRAFDVRTQLSEEKFESIYIVPQISKHELLAGSLPGSLPPQTLIASHDLCWCKERIDSIWNEEPVAADEDSFADREQMRSKLITGDDFLRSAGAFRRLHFGQRPAGTPDAVFSFRTHRQPVFHKNFDLVG